MMLIGQWEGLAACRAQIRVAEDKDEKWPF